MVDRQFLAARMLAEYRRRLRRSSSHVCTDTRCGDRRRRLGLGHPASTGIADHPSRI
jgi:hypothetical protein